MCVCLCDYCVCLFVCLSPCSSETVLVVDLGALTMKSDMKRIIPDVRVSCCACTYHFL